MHRTLLLAAYTCHAYARTHAMHMHVVRTRADADFLPSLVCWELKRPADGGRNRERDGGISIGSASVTSAPGSVSDRVGKLPVAELDSVGAGARDIERDERC